MQRAWVEAELQAEGADAGLIASLGELDAWAKKQEAAQATSWAAWAADLFDGDSARIESAPTPASPTEEEVAAAKASSEDPQAQPEQEGTLTLSSTRARLTGLTTRKLVQVAQQVNIAEDVLDDLMDSEEPRAALMEAILGAASPDPTPAPATSGEQAKPARRGKRKRKDKEDL